MIGYQVFIIGMNEEEIDEVLALSSGHRQDSELGVEDLVRTFTGLYPVLFLRYCEPLGRLLYPQEIVDALNDLAAAGRFYDYTPMYSNRGAVEAIRALVFKAIAERAGLAVYQGTNGPPAPKVICNGFAGERDRLCMFVLADEPLPDRRKPN